MRKVLVISLLMTAACSGSTSGRCTTCPQDGRHVGVLHWNQSGQPMMTNITMDLTFVMATPLTPGGISGSFSTAVGWSGQVFGSNDFVLMLTSPCEGSLRGPYTITQSGRRLSGSFSGTTPCTGTIAGTFEVDRSA